MLSLRQALSLDSIRNIGGDFNKLSTNFDGINDCVIIAQSAALRPQFELSISLWMKPTEWQISGSASDTQDPIGCLSSGGWRIKMVKDGGATAKTRMEFEIRVNDTDGAGSPGYITSTLSSSIVEGFSGWKNIIATYANGVARIYHNTSSSFVTPGNADAGARIVYSGSPVPIFIGADAQTTTAPEQEFSGSVDEVAIFNQELSSANRTAIYNGGKPADLTGMTGLVGWWRMGDGATFPTIPDASSNSNNGTMTNMVAGDITTDTP